MSRWSKQNMVIPLDELIYKEKENTNRPIAARSCGTVGRWGKMGFTSTRTYALKLLPSLSPGQSPIVGTTNGGSSPINEPPAPKPKKFFKSRNTFVAPLDFIRSQFMQQHMPHLAPTSSVYISPAETTALTHMVSEEFVDSPPNGGIKIKIKQGRIDSRKVANKNEKTRKKKEPVPKKKPEPKKPKENKKKMKPESAPSRILGRSRKPVNYNEDDDSIPYRDSVAKIPKAKKNDKKMIFHEDNEFSLDAADAMASPSTLSHNYKFSSAINSSVDHPPIVLRISKGTSRLISTDSEGQNLSPARNENNLSPPPPPPPAGKMFSDISSSSPNNTFPSTFGTAAISTTEELLSVLSGEPTISSTNVNLFPKSPPQENFFTGSGDQNSEINYEANISPDKPPKERLKLIIKTDVLKKALAAEKAEKKNKSKKHHNKASKLAAAEALFKTPSPQPGNDNYDLYKQLTISPSEPDFDSQCSVLGSTSSKGHLNAIMGSLVTSATQYENNYVAGSDITSDLETSQHSSLVAPPSDIESRLESMMDTENDTLGRVTGTGGDSNESRQNEIRMKLQMLAEEEEPLNEDIYEILTGGNEAEHIKKGSAKKANKRKGKANNAKNVVNKVAKVVSPPKKPEALPSRRMTRGRNAPVQDEIQFEFEDPIIQESVKKVTVKTATGIGKRGAAAKKVTPIVETINDSPTKEAELINIPGKTPGKTPGKAEKGKRLSKAVTKLESTAPADVIKKEKPVKENKKKSPAKKGKSVQIPKTPEIEMSISVPAIIIPEEIVKVAKKKSVPKAKKIPTVVIPTRIRREAATKANAAIVSSSESNADIIEGKKKSPPKRARIAKKSNDPNNMVADAYPIKPSTLKKGKEKITEQAVATNSVKNYGSRKRKAQPPVQFESHRPENMIEPSSLQNDESANVIDLPNIDSSEVSNPNSSSDNSSEVQGIEECVIESHSEGKVETTIEEEISPVSSSSSPSHNKDYKINKFKRSWYEPDSENNIDNSDAEIYNAKMNADDDDDDDEDDYDDDDDDEPVNKKANNMESNYFMGKSINTTSGHEHSSNNHPEKSLATSSEMAAASSSTSDDIGMDENIQQDDLEEPKSSNASVKLVISKKKGSIFKSRALVSGHGASGSTAAAEKKRHVYKHTWDAKHAAENMEFEDGSNSAANTKTLQSGEIQSTTNNKDPVSIFDDFNDEGGNGNEEEDDDEEDQEDQQESPIHKLTRIVRPVSATGSGKFFNDNNEQLMQVGLRCDKKSKEFYTVVRNVKAAHQIQEIGEYQEMDDDVEYILDALQPHNPISTRCLSALQLATKCMIPAFRMHVRAHGTVTKFFKALRDAKNDLSLGLCTAAIMFILSQDTLNIDLDRDSLELMMNLLEVDVVEPTGDIANYDRNKQKVRELCEEIKAQGKGAHLNIDSISVGTLAMETLLSLTSKKAGEWFKEELRELGGLEHIIKTICECCHQISDYVVNWTEVLLDKLRTIERCLRVLENVSQLNEANQRFILKYKKGHAINTLFKLYKLCDSEIALYPTTDTTPKDNPGVVLRETLVPTLKVLINLTHPFDSGALGSLILGEIIGIFDTSFHILLQAPNYVPERCIFDLSILVLLLLINLTMHTIPNRKLIMQSRAPSDFGNQFDKVPAIKALIEYFYRCEEQARMVEKNTDAILENPEQSKTQSQEEVDETVTKLLQKAGHHMEHTYQASYAGILIGHLISDNKENEIVIRSYLRENGFGDIVNVLEKYYNFMNLTASSEATVVSHIKSTKNIIDYFKECDSHSNDTNNDDNNIGNNNNQQQPEQQEAATSSTSSSSVATRSTPRVYKTYSQR